MEFLIFLFIGWFIWSVVGNAAKNQKAKQLPPPALWDPSQIPPEHVLQVVGGPPAVLPARAASEESTSELMWDETAGDTEVDATGATPAEVVALEATEEMSVAARPMRAEAVSLEHEVDWEAEHERFHRKYVDGHSAGSAARHGLLDEMRDPGALRRAVLMAEILGPPKSLRK
ncbi:MAG TPA: hypothetical protein VEQ60_05735 [Longimicrobium sp.]|nr:hypothetical protein [Longimicrobium sp.]